LNKIMNKKIAILISAMALSAFGAHAQARAGVSASAAGGQVGVGGQTAGVGGQVGVGQVNGQVAPNGQVNGQVAPNGQIAPQGQGKAEVNNGQQTSAQATGSATANGQVNGGAQENGGQVTGGAQGTIAQPGAPRTFAPGTFAPGDDPNRFPRRNRQGNTNQFSSGVTNQTSGVTNQFQPASDGFSGNPNQGGLTPTSRDPRIRRLYATNAAANSASGAQDVAATPFDKNMATSLHSRLGVQGISAASSADVHFMANGGQITLTGTVPSAADKAQIVSIIQRSPGVVGVTDQLTVGTPATGATTIDQSGAINNGAPVPAPASNP
jgi:hypothetical protein